MGYYTFHKFEIKSGVSAEQLDKIHKQMDKEPEFAYTFGKEYADCGDATWYDHEDHMRILSVVFPDVHFTLYGWGEENEDIWQEHYLGGKMQRCNAEIVMPSFDPEKLK